MKEDTRTSGIKQSVNIVELIREKGVSLKKVGRSFVGLCPFHKEKKPSFTVDPGKGLWHCFGCDRGGDAFTFLQELEGLTFRQALGELSNSSQGGNGRKFSHASQPSSPVQHPTLTTGAQELLNRVTDFYHRTFFEDARGLEYLRDRRNIHTKEICEAFRVGFANGSLLNTLPKSGTLIETLKEVGILSCYLPHDYNHTFVHKTDPFELDPS